jgi:tetratricopeptide (TPR) repeat protein
MVGNVPEIWRRPDPALTSAPDPSNVFDGSEFVETMRELRRWAGQPSLRRLRMLGGKTTAISGDVVDALPISTTSTVLAGRRLPILPRGEFVDAYVRACLHARAVPDEIVVEEVHRWMSARHRLEAGPRRAVGPEQNPLATPALAGNGSRRQFDGLVPRQLPGPPRLFAGRTDKLTELTGLAETAGDTMPIAAITGEGGVGKTWLALHWAHQNLDRFPDGQLYVNLRGFDPVADPVHPAEALYGFLSALGVDSPTTSATLDAQAALYRSLVAGRRMLIVLDGARDGAHVEALLPGSPTCMVLVTSRSRLCTLVTSYGAYPLAVRILQAADAWNLLTRRLGLTRVSTEREAARAVIDKCAGLPLALCIVAARAAGEPDLPLSAISEELAETAGRLDVLTELRPVFTSSYRALDPQAAAMFRLLGLFTGPDIGLPAIGCLTALPSIEARKRLRDLQNANLIQRSGAERYRMHDLLRLYSIELAQDELTPKQRTVAERRLVDFYLHTAHACFQAFEQLGTPPDLGRPAEGCRPQRIGDRAGALAWMAAEHSCLLAAQDVAVRRGWHLQVWQLARALNHFHRWRGHLDDNLAVWQAALSAAERLNDHALRAEAHLRLGPASARLGLDADATTHLQQALDLFLSVGDVRGLAGTHETFAAVLDMLGDVRTAMEHACRSLTLFDQLGDVLGQAGALNTAGWFHARHGCHDQARAFCERALALYREHGVGHGEAGALDSLAYIAMQTGEYNLALTYYGDALALHHHLGSKYDTATTLTNLGDALLVADRETEARRAWSLALANHLQYVRPKDAESVRKRLDSLADRP